MFPTGAQYRQSATYQLGDERQQRNHNGGQNQLAVKHGQIETRSHAEKEKGREELIDSSNARLKVPARRVFGKGQAGEKCSDDGGHSDLYRSVRKSNTDGQSYYQRRIMGGHALQPRLHALHDTRSVKEHDQRKA